MASNNMYRVGDFVYFESSATAPYQIRRIDELNKTSTGAVEAKVACYYRRRDVSSALINQAEKYYVSGGSCGGDSDDELDNENGANYANENSTKRPNQTVTDVQRHQLKHRELFLSRQIECLPATHIRGKCSVTLFNEAEPLTNYLNRDEAFYYKLIYDPSLKTLQEDRGSMRIGSDHQSEIQCLLKSKIQDPRMSEVHEELMWTPNSMSEQEVDMFCLLACAVGTFGRAHDNPTITRQPLLLSAAAAASRDITRQYAHNLLHDAGYDFSKAIASLVPNGQQLMVYRDQLEDWSANEAHLFEEALDKYSKVFPTILTDCLPWKTHKAIVELYYFWKTTDRYIRQRRTKLAAQEHKLKQVYIPNYSKPNPAVLYNASDKTNRGCESCGAQNSPQWYAWGAPNPTCRLCANCWSYWKRYGGLKNPESKAERAASFRSQQSSSSTTNETTNTNGTDAKSVGGPINITGSINHQFKSHPIGIPSKTPSLTAVNKEADDADGKQLLNCTYSPTMPTAAKCCDALTFFADFVGTPRGTQCFRTPALLRLARIACPHLIQPTRLARCPNQNVLVNAKQMSKKLHQQAKHNVSDLSSLTTPEECDSERHVLSYSALKIAAEPIISRLRDPVSVLNRTKKSLSLDTVIQNLVARKGITLQNIDIAPSRTVSQQSNGPMSPGHPRRKRPFSPATIPLVNEPSVKRPNISDNENDVDDAQVVESDVDPAQNTDTSITSGGNRKQDRIKQPNLKIDIDHSLPSSSSSSSSSDTADSVAMHLTNGDTISRTSQLDKLPDDHTPMNCTAPFKPQKCQSNSNGNPSTPTIVTATPSTIITVPSTSITNTVVCTTSTANTNATSENINAPLSNSNDSSARCPFASATPNGLLNDAN